MTNKVIECMTGEEIVNAISEINEQMEEIEKIFTPFVGKKFEEIPADRLDAFRVLSTILIKLTNARSELRCIARDKFGIFVI